MTHPLNGEQLPVWVANYVLASYGEGAVMAVPAHDERDFEFANKYSLQIKQVIEHAYMNQKNQWDEEVRQRLYAFDPKHWKASYCEIPDGTLINSGKYNGLRYQEAFNAISADLEAKNLGKKRHRSCIRYPT